jgi:hypothetical protein
MLELPLGLVALLVKSPAKVFIIPHGIEEMLKGGGKEKMI